MQKWNPETIQEAIKEFWTVLDASNPKAVSATCHTCQTVAVKRSGNYIDAARAGKSGCILCFKALQQTPEYKAIKRGEMEPHKERFSKLTTDRLKIWWQENPEAKQNMPLHSEAALAKSAAGKKRFWQSPASDALREQKSLNTTQLNNPESAKKRAISRKKFAQENPDKELARANATRTRFKLDNEKIQTKRRAKYFAAHGVEHHSKIAGIRKKMFTGGAPTKNEKIFSDFLQNNGFQYEAQYYFNEKLWDFGVFIDGKLNTLVEIDGVFFHGAVYEGPRGNYPSFGTSDHERFLKTPEGVKLVIFDDTKLQDGITAFLEAVGIDHAAWSQKMLAQCLSEPFPYRDSSPKKLSAAWHNLKTKDVLDTQLHEKDFTGTCLVNHFHRSIYHSHKKGQIAPVDAWKDPRFLEEAIANRTIYHPGKNAISSYHVARAFDHSGICRRVSVFSPLRARWLLANYAADAKTVIDPFHGFSGRMLGALSLGMSYTGLDCRLETIQEAQCLADFLEASVTLCQQDIETQTEILEADVLLTCSPYGDKEIWEDGKSYRSADAYIEMCLQKFKCKKYIFIVDKTEKYQTNIVAGLENTSHRSKSKELVLFFEPSH